MAKQKLGFKVHVKEIGNGFIVYLENEHGVNWEELYCAGPTEVILQMEVWVKRLFKEFAGKDKQGE